MKLLFNIDPKSKAGKNWLKPEAILQRFGARPAVQSMGVLTTPEAEFWYACRMFQQAWVGMFSTSIDLTFMPEIWPGMLIRLRTFDFQAYVTSVVHRIDFSDGGAGFTTQVNVMAPSSTKGGGLFGLVRGK